MHGRAPVAAAFAGHAMVVGTLASRLPAIKSGAGLTDARLGAALFAMAVGTLAGSRLGGTLATRHGARRVVRAGMPLHGLMLAAIALPDGLAALAAVMLCAGIVGAAVDIAMNAEAVVVERASGRPLMSGLHGMWSVGLLIGAGLGAGAAAA